MTRWLPIIGMVVVLLAATGVRAVELGTLQDKLDGRTVASQETTLGNFVADALRTTTGADIAIVHAMAFRADALIPQGAVNDQAFRNSLAGPTSKVAILKLTPAQLTLMMQRALSRYPEPNMAFLQISGMDVQFDSSKSAGSRVTAISIGSKLLDLRDSQQTFSVAMPGQLAIGGAGYVVVFTDEVAKTLEMRNDLTLLAAIEKMFERSKGVVIPKLERRLRDISPQPTK